MHARRNRYVLPKINHNVLYAEYNIYRFTVGPHANAYACIVVTFAG